MSSSIHDVSRRAFGPAALALCLLLPLPLSAGDAGRLEVVADSGRRIASLPMPEGEAWCLEWNLSLIHI